MPHYRIHRLEPGPREGFRWAAHTGGLAIVKSKDYRPDGEISASTPYSAWVLSRNNGQPLAPGDLLERVTDSSSELYIAKYIGFEPAQWFVPQNKPNEAVDSLPGATSGSEAST